VSPPKNWGRVLAFVRGFWSGEWRRLSYSELCRVRTGLHPWPPQEQNYA